MADKPVEKPRTSDVSLEGARKRTFEINIQIASTLHVPVHPEDIPSAYDFKAETEVAAKELLRLIGSQK